MYTYSHVTNKIKTETIDIMENLRKNSWILPKKATGNNPVANPKEIQARVGNSRLVTTMDAYVHVTKKMKNEAVDIFAQRLKRSLI